jgi:transposase
LQLQLIDLRKFVFTGKQEKFKPNPNATEVQLDLFPNDKLADVVVEKKTITTERTKTTTSVRVKHNGRNPLPNNLRRVTVELNPTEDVTGLTPVSEQVTETLEYQKAEIFVKRIVRKEYLKPTQDGLNAKRVIAPLADNGFAKCIAGTSLLSHIAISKYIDHLPIYRIQQILKRDKVKVDDATMYGWLKRVCGLIEPLYDLHKKTVLSTQYLSCDETTISVLDEEKKGKTHQGYFWAYYDTVKRLVLFEYQKGRAALYPKQLLQNYQGYLLSDGYEGYTQFDDMPHITAYNCWAHARRKFYDAQRFNKDKCEAVLCLIAELYAIERAEATSTAEQRQKARQEQATPVLLKIKELLEQYLKQEAPGTPLYMAANYTMKRWEKLNLYTSNGNLKIDNNLIENSIRPIAIGRKNYLFAGSHESAQRSAMLYSLFYTCKEYDINPNEWFQHVLDHIYETKLTDLHLLLPQNYRQKLEQ